MTGTRGYTAMKKHMVKIVVLAVVISIGAALLSACQWRAIPTTAGQDPAAETAGEPDQANKPPESEPVNEPKNIEKKKIKAKGLYLTATSAGSRLKHFIELANTTEINSYVIDVKNDYGNVCHNSEVPLAKEVGAIDVRYDADKVTKELHDNNIYAIARIVCFKDPILAKGKPELAVKNKDGGLYVYDKMYWVNPYNRQSWDYNIDLAKEALRKGFDEIQFDYVRFPEGKKSDMVFGDTGDKKYYEVINEFLAYARQQLPDAVLAADVFAIICESPGDTENIGQYFEYIGKDMDYICPMAYPSHYARGQIVNNIRFPKPDLDPYGVVKNTLLRAKERLDKVEGSKPGIRTFLQDFTATWIGAGNWQYYEDEQVRQQIQAVYDAGYEEWFLWDHMNDYRVGALKKEQ